jgi:hypothetical protein
MVELVLAVIIFRMVFEIVLLFAVQSKKIFIPLNFPPLS